jgi:hypothetical protein
MPQGAIGPRCKERSAGCAGESRESQLCRQDSAMSQDKLWAPLDSPLLTRKWCAQVQKQARSQVGPLPGSTGVKHTENQAQIGGAYGNQLSLEAVVMFTKVSAPHASCVVAVNEAACHQFVAPSQKL